MWKYLCYAVGFLFGSVMLFGGAFVLHSMPSLFEGKIKSQLPIVRGTDAYTRYTASSVPLQVKMYMFNVTNADEVSKTGAKPILNQVGPFSLSERRIKNVIGISHDNTTLDYKLIRTYYFNASDSIPLDSAITMPNVPAFSALFKAMDKKAEDDSAADPVSVISDYLKNETVYLTHTAQEWLFQGIKLDFLDALNADGIVFDDQPHDNKFGFYYKKKRHLG